MDIAKKTLIRPVLTPADLETIKTAFNLLGDIPAGGNSEDILVGRDGEICTLSNLVQALNAVKEICVQLVVETPNTTN